MVENSLGRFWLESHPNKELQEKWKYYVEEAPQEEDVKLKLNQIRNDNINIKPEDIKVIDPCMGSGHILVYVFDVLMDIYISEGYTEKDATISILENNIYGLDIDDRAYQLSYFALMMKARTYHRRIFNKNIKPLVFSIKESNLISDKFIKEFTDKYPILKENLHKILQIFSDAKEYGSVINIKIEEPILNELNNSLNIFKNNKTNLNMFNYKFDINLLENIIKQMELLNYKYDIVITNPPYMGTKSMNDNLKDFLNSNYPNSKSDLCAVFIEKCKTLTKCYGLFSMITQQSFMFLSTFEKLRNKILNEDTIINMIHLGAHAFEEIGGEVVQVTAFVFKNESIENYNSTFHRLIEFNSEKSKEIEFFNDKNKFITQTKKFNKIPGNPIAFWVNDNIINNFDNSICIDEICDHTGSQNITANNNKYLRYFWEVSNINIGINNKWVFYAKGGNFKRYYGNLDLVVDWSPEARNFYESNKTSNLLDKKILV